VVFDENRESSSSKSTPTTSATISNVLVCSPFVSAASSQLMFTICRVCSGPGQPTFHHKDSKILVLRNFRGDVSITHPVNYATGSGVSSGGWVIELYQKANTVNELLSIPVLSNVDGYDTIGWGDTGTRQFTIQSAYRLHNGPIHVEGDWNNLWAWRGPHRIQTFIWLAARERILTNLCRSKWRVEISPICSRCGKDDETVVSCVAGLCLRYSGMTTSRSI
ncbi:ribonuclease H, partial [Trifolium pratense]